MASEVKFWLSRVLDTYLWEFMSIKAEASANLIFYSVPEMFWDFWQPKYLKAGDMLEKVCHTHPPLQPQHFVGWHKGEK